jgi:hypothetical protein
MRFPRHQPPECPHIGIAWDIALEVLCMCDMAERLLDNETNVIGSHDECASITSSEIE